MFDKKYSISLLDCKWQVVKRHIKVPAVPRQDEYVFIDGLYYEVVNVVHNMDSKKEILVIISETAHQVKPD